MAALRHTFLLLVIVAAAIGPALAVDAPPASASGGSQTLSAACTVTFETFVTHETDPITVGALAPDAATAGSTMTVTIPTSTTTLPSVVAGNAVTSYGFAISYTVTGGTVVAGSGLLSGAVQINGNPTAATIDLVGNAVTLSVPGPFVPGDLVIPDATFSVVVGATGSTTTVSAVERDVSATVPALNPPDVVSTCVMPANTLASTLATAPTIDPTAAQVGVPYVTTIAPFAGVAPYHWAFGSGHVPPGLTLDPATGVLAGTPTTEGVFKFKLSVTDSAAKPKKVNTKLTIGVAPVGITIAPATLSGAQLGVAYETLLTASGGTEKYKFKVTAGALPAGVRLRGSGMFTGKPTVTGDFSFTVTATDKFKFTTTRAFTLNVT